jgi:hypothetical protein
MSEEQENEGTWSGLKKTLLGTVATVVTAGGAWVGTTLFGGGDEPAPAPAAAPVINITNSNQQQQSQGGGTTKIIERVKEVPAEKKEAPKKKSEKETLEAAPAW